MDWRCGAVRWPDIVCGAALVLCVAGPAVGQTVYTDEAEFVGAVPSRTSIHEGFEDDSVWGPTRNPLAIASVTSQGATWTSNHPANAISTGSGPARTGDWGFYSNPHGDQSVTNPTDIIEDGFTGSSDRSLVAAGGWFKGLFGSEVQLIVDGDDANAIELGAVDAIHRFYGIVIVVTDVVPEGATGGVAAMVSEVNGAALQGTNDGWLIPAAVLVLQ